MFWNAIFEGAIILISWFTIADYCVFLWIVLLSKNIQEKRTQDRIRVFRIVIRDRVKAQKTTIHSHNNPFLTKKIVKNRYYGNENFSLARGRIEVFRNHMTVRKLHKSVWDRIQESYKSARLLNLNPHSCNSHF